MYCRNCGNPINKNASFCTNCGNQSGNPAQPQGYPQPQPSLAHTDYPNTPPRKKSNILIILTLVFGGFVAVSVLALVLFFLLQSPGGKNTQTEHLLAGERFPSLANVMDDKSIKYSYVTQDIAVGNMVVPSILDYWGMSEEVPVEITEITYNNVSDTWGAIDAYGKLLSETYGFEVTHPPTDYPNYGEGYRFCELIKNVKTNDGEHICVYVSAIYSKDERVIKVRFGTFGQHVSIDGIGPIKLDALKESSN